MNLPRCSLKRKIARQFSVAAAIADSVEFFFKQKRGPRELGWWQLKYFVYVHPYLGKISVLTRIFQMV